MAWTPKRGAQGSAAGSPTSPAPRRRRASAAKDAAATNIPDTPALPPSTGARPSGGKNNQAGFGRDERPRDIKVRLGKRWSEIVGAIKAGEYTWADFVEGLDPEELARGQLKSAAGTFSGRPPSMVPREFLLACQREMKARFEVLFSKEVLGIAEQYLAMAQSPTLKEETKAKMLQYAMERVFGGIPKDIILKQEAPWEQMVVNVMGDDTDREVAPHLARRYAGYKERMGADADTEEKE
jgi:hypothetical protein